MATSRAPGRGEWQTALLCGLLFAVPLSGALRLLQQGVPWALLLHAATSLLAFGLYWHDKRSARAGRWRIPERILHSAELLGGWPGALLAQQMFRHKTRKVSYQLVFWGIVGLHQALWVDWLLDGHFIRQLLPETLAAL